MEGRTLSNKSKRPPRRLSATDLGNLLRDMLNYLRDTDEEPEEPEDPEEGEG